MEADVEYGWVLLVLVALEGLLAADNALVLAIMVKHLPESQRKKALFFGLLGAFSSHRVALLNLISGGCMAGTSNWRIISSLYFHQSHPETRTQRQKSNGGC